MVNMEHMTSVFEELDLTMKLEDLIEEVEFTLELTLGMRLMFRCALNPKSSSMCMSALDYWWRFRTEGFGSLYCDSVF